MRSWRWDHTLIYSVEELLDKFEVCSVAELGATIKLAGAINFYEVRTTVDVSGQLTLGVHDRSTVIGFPVTCFGMYALAWDLEEQLNAEPWNLPMEIWDPDFAEKHGRRPDHAWRPDDWGGELSA